MANQLANVKESAIERELVERVEALGGVCDKVCLLGRRGFFDRLVILPGRGVKFVELKRPKGGRVSAHQKLCHATYAALGVETCIIRNSEDINRLLSDP